MDLQLYNANTSQPFTGAVPLNGSVPVKSSLNPSSLGGVSSNTSIVTTQTNIHNLTTCTLHGVSAGTTNVHFHAIFSDGSSGDQDVSVTVS